MSFTDMFRFVKYRPTYRLVIVKPNLANLQEFSAEGTDYEFNDNPDYDKTLYIYHDDYSDHYVCCSSPISLYRSYKKDTSWSFCYRCLCGYDKRGETGCNCMDDGGTGVPAKKRAKQAHTCEHCKEIYYWLGRTGHKCYSKKCPGCQLYHSTLTPKNRCALRMEEKSFMKHFIDEDESTEEEETKTKRYDLFSWDIESSMSPLIDEYGTDFECDENGNFIIDDNGECVTYTVKKFEQVPNRIWCKSIITGAVGSYNSMKDFLRFALTHNEGLSIFVAHNSSGYDSRLLFDEAIRFVKKGTKVDPTLNGGRMMCLKIGKTVFRDSMLHLPGSLSKLAKGFGLNLYKGHFPHLFNKGENYDYVGPLPDRKYFDLSFSVSTQKDLDEFNEWYDNFSGEWNFQTELDKYCRNDVEILAQIMKLYSDTYTSLIGEYYPHLKISPWFSSTCAGYVHKLFIRNLHEGIDFSTMDNEDVQAYNQTTWCALEAEEHYFAKSALRGGSTNSCSYFYDGVIHYKDIQSSYPSVQLKEDFPVGTPTIHIFDSDFYPCNIHFSEPLEICRHDLSNKKRFQRHSLSIVEHQTQPTIDWIRSFFGFICVDVTPPSNLYHPVLMTFDKEKFKCVHSLLPLTKETFTSVELNRAIDMGYVVTKVYRADRYNRAASKWRGLLSTMYLLKMRNSQNPPTLENQERMKREFKERIDLDLGDMNLWKKNPTLKQICKTPPTSAWGKHAETVDHPQSFIIDDSMHEEGFDFYRSLQNNRNEIKDFVQLGDRTIYRYKETRSIKRPDMHRGYLPCAVFVTSYGRLKLWEEMNKLGKRVLMHDTDSIQYIHQEGGYDIPEGDCIGDWETEDFEKDNGGINGYVSIGPKSYGNRAVNGKEFIKCKGVSVKLAHEKLLNFDEMRDILKEGKCVKLPQFTMDYNLGKGITTRKFLKFVQFNPGFVKGVYNEEEYRWYPYGYKED